MLNAVTKPPSVLVSRLTLLHYDARKTAALLAIYQATRFRRQGWQPVWCRHLMAPDLPELPPPIRPSMRTKALWHPIDWRYHQTTRMQIIAVRRVLILTMQRTSDFRRRRQLLTWKISPGLTPYLDAVTFMENRADEIAKGRADRKSVV